MNFSTAPFARCLLFAVLFNATTAYVAAQPSNTIAPVAAGQSALTAKEVPVQSDAARLIIEKINAVRRLAGLQPVELDETLSKGCRLHAQYLVLNRAHPKTQGLDAHIELEGLPGYTPEGDKAARVSNLYWGRDLTLAVDRWIGGLYHRIPFLRPNLKQIGLGVEQEVIVLDVISGIVGVDVNAVAYPGDGQGDVPTDYGIEFPDPLPKDASREAGYPITLQFPIGANVASVEAEIIDSAGSKVEFHLSDPERPATSFPQQSTICLIPIRPLVVNTTYKVSVKANVDGKEVRKSWSFNTREAQALK